MRDDETIGYPSLLAGGLMPMYPRFSTNQAVPPFGLQVADATRYVNRDGGRSIFDGPTNGNWGGKSWSGGIYSPPGASMGSAPPLDSGDDAYMAHDFCYDRAGDDAGSLRDCDKTLVDRLRALPKDSRSWPRPPRPGTEPDSDGFRKWAIRWFDRRQPNGRAR